ncbi:uncharacterized protein LOC106657501 [Trichogramma pretiosum]|uniref:uncharacterized protein LOC106657501 n=1 Tax=Trichogramma pretiosum TaxID=7493 RepID=UPI000C71C431|nr:uncharacterized protein LOC106657501 [Trichogramma pretiosum]
MSHPGKILALLLVVSLGAEASASSSEPILFFGRQSYKDLSWVDVKCTEHLPDQNRTRCVVNLVLEKEPRDVLTNACHVRLRTGRYPLQPDSMQVVRFGDYRAILSWQVQLEHSNKTSWRLGVMDLKRCRFHESPMDHGWKLQPVSFVVHENEFTVVVFSESPDSPCAVPDSGRNVPRCKIRFDYEGDRIGNAVVWFVQPQRDDKMIVEPLGNSMAGYLLIETSNPKNSTSVVARASIIKNDGKLLTLGSYELVSSTSGNPYDNIAYSKVNGIIGICVETKGDQLICSQFDREGNKTLEKSIPVKRKNKYFMMNLPRPGGMMLLSYICTDPDNLCNLVDSITISISKIESNGDIVPDVFERKELYTCNKKLYRGDVQLFSVGPDHYCYTQACIGYPKDASMRSPMIDSICFLARSKEITDSNTRGIAYFDHHSYYKNTTHLTVYCGHLAHRDDGKQLCEVSRYIDQRLQKTCEVWLQSDQQPIKPEHMQALLFNDDKAILSWQAYANELHGAWRLLVVHFEDCSWYQPETKSWPYVPTNIVVYKNYFAAVVTSTTEDSCKMSGSGYNVKRCMMLFDDKGQNTAGPLNWFLQSERDDDMTLVPLEYESSVNGHLLIETSKKPNWLFARVAIVKNDGQLVTLRSYQHVSDKSGDLHDAIAYSTDNGFIGVCVEIRENGQEKIICNQFDRDGKQTLEKIFNLGRKQGFAVINLAKPGTMLLLHYVCTDPQSRCENRNSSVVVVSRIENDKDTPQPVFNSFSEYQCDRRFNIASAQLFVKDSGQYCFTQVCYRDPKDQDNFYRPVIYPTCLPEKALEATADQKMLRFIL